MRVQGPVMFDENGDRKVLTQIEQLQNYDEVQVAVYDPTSPAINKINWHANQTIFWKGRHLAHFKIHCFCPYCNFQHTRCLVIGRQRRRINRPRRLIIFIHHTMLAKYEDAE